MAEPGTGPRLRSAATCAGRGDVYLSGARRRGARRVRGLTDPRAGHAGETVPRNCGERPLEKTQHGHAEIVRLGRSTASWPPPCDESSTDLVASVRRRRRGTVRRGSRALRAQSCPTPSKPHGRHPASVAPREVARRRRRGGSRDGPGRGTSQRGARETGYAAPLHCEEGLSRWARFLTWKRAPRTGLSSWPRR